MEIGLLIAQAFYFMLPGYIANMSPVLFKGILKPLAVPVDFRKKFRGRPIFGSHKTLRGLILAPVAGIIIFLLQVLLFSSPFFQRLSIIDYSQLFLDYNVLPGFLFGFGTIFGDLVKSFFKRQFNIKPGQSWIPFDQIDFVIGALLFISFVYMPSWQVILAILIITPLLHIAADHIGYYLKIREVKW